MAKSNIDKLMELKQLYEQGILTKEEMEAEQAKILNASTPKVESSVKEIQQNEAVDPSKNRNKKNSRNDKLILGIAAIAVVIVVAIVALYLNKQEEPAQISSDDIGLASEDEKTNFVSCFMFQNLKLIML